MKLPEHRSFPALGETSVLFVSLLPQLVALDCDARLQDTVLNVTICTTTALFLKSDGWWCHSDQCMSLSSL